MNTEKRYIPFFKFTDFRICIYCIYLILNDFLKFSQEVYQESDKVESPIMGNAGFRINF
ncbi:hypothetical protein D1872_274850 [compost metagenome]